MTDPLRQADPVALAQTLPPGSGLIYRHFGDPHRERLANLARAVTDRRGLMFLIAADPDLARICGADGVHWPERDLHLAARARARGDHRPFTAAAHSPMALRRANAAGVDAALVSTVFPSASPSAGRPIGPISLSRWIAETDLPVYALGGVNARTIKRLVGLGVSGVAVIGAIKSAGQTRT